MNQTEKYLRDPIVCKVLYETLLQEMISDYLRRRTSSNEVSPLKQEERTNGILAR